MDAVQEDGAGRVGLLLAEHGPVADGQAMGAARCGNCSQALGVAVPWPCAEVHAGSVVSVKPWGWSFRELD
jgi:hypothetical protein